MQKLKKTATTEAIFVLDNTFSLPPVITNSKDADTAHSISQPLATWKRIVATNYANNNGDLSMPPCPSLVVSVSAAFGASPDG